MARVSGQYSVSLYPIDAAVLAEVQERMHLNTLSGALQYVIRRFAEQNGVEGRSRLVAADAAAVKADGYTA